MRSGRDEVDSALNAQLVSPYLPCRDLWVITTHYNPAGYANRRNNYRRFAQPILDAGINLLTVECAFGDDPFELAPSPAVIQVRGASVMWMKERLLNLAIEHLPAQATKVAWVDADLLFTNPAWAQQTAVLLEQWPIVQPFQQVVQLAENPAAAPVRSSLGFAFQHQVRRRLVSGGHGTYGYAWAARRDLVQRHGIYDAAIANSGDLLWAYAASGQLNTRAVRIIAGATRRRSNSAFSRALIARLERLLLVRCWVDWRVRRTAARLERTARRAPALAHYQDWAMPWYAAVRGRMSFAPGAALHLWHGAQANRHFGRINQSLHRYSFDPVTDLRLNAQGVWEWASPKAELHRVLADYFYSRREDGDDSSG